MKIRDTRAVLTSFDHKRGPFGLERCLPEEPGKVHAISRSALRFASTDAVFASKDINFDDVPVGAFCGRTAWVILPREFDNSDPDACADCGRMAKLYVDDYSKWFAEYERRRSRNLY
ncbi:hypothetical protein G6020_00805 [Dietzia sp. B19]|uniref:hypothetical protein n=1 Tax=Dietzia sp. B19 TaxID=1630632 RepID=UPI0015FA82CF|nr:hypothetical protein [Dietzia sp. B19]MBB1055966.1 hypothetical protein [Dietzia sp. B19]